MIKVTYFTPSDGGCDYYRAILPMETCHRKQVMSCLRMTPVSLVLGIKTNKGDFETSMGADVMYIPRNMSNEFLNHITEESWKYNSGRRIVIDFDDDMFNVSPLSEHYKDFGTKDYDIVLPDGSIKNIWKDDVNIDLKKNRFIMDAVKRSLEKADMITTTTSRLADRYRKFNENVAVLPNCVDLRIWNKLPLIPSDEIRLYWSGGQSHYEDWYQIKDVIPEIMHKYPKVKLVLAGYMWPSTLRNIPDSRIEFHPWVHTKAHPYRTAIMNPTISLIPLRDTEFNRNKSAIKWIEMAALEVPSVATCIPPYKNMIELSKEDNGVYIRGNDMEGWYQGISRLIEDTELRQKIGQEARLVVEKNFDINTQYNKWVKAYKDMMKRPSQLEVN